MPKTSYTNNHLVQEIIHVGAVPELRKITRREKYLEAGSAVTVNSLLKGTGQNILPPILYEGLSVMATEPLRNMITIGGSLASAGAPLHLPTLLVTLGAQLELKRKSKTQWMSIYRFLRSEQMNLLQSGNVITKVRIPLDDTNFSFFRTLGSPYLRKDDSLIFCAAAYLTEQSILRIRIAISFPRTNIWRWTELEKKLTLIQLPIQRTEPLVHEFRNRIEEFHGINAYQKRGAVKLFTQMLFKMNHH